MYKTTCTCAFVLQYSRFIVPSNIHAFTLNSPAVLLKEYRSLFHTRAACLNNKPLPNQESSVVESKEETSIALESKPEKKKKLTVEERFRNFLFSVFPPKSVDRYKLVASVHYMYEKLMDEVNIQEFFDEFEMPDTFASWFTVAELHAYIMSTRLMKDPKVGMHARDMMTEAFWNDVEFRSRRLGPRVGLYRKKQLKILGFQFQAAFYGYDEGVQANDMVLAAVVWRRFFGFQCDDARKIERVVKYIRVQINYLNVLAFDDIVSNKKVLTIPLKEVRID